MDTNDLEALEWKMGVLKRFAVELRKHPENQYNIILADSLDEVLRTCSSEEIDKAFVMCEGKFSEV